MHALDLATTFRRRLLAREPMVGLFLCIAGGQVPEVLEGTGFDYLVLDAEQGPWGTAELDAGLLAARATGLPALVRVREPLPGLVQQAFDLGAAGVILPHVSSAAQAAELASVARFRDGARGFAAQNRAAGYGRMKLAEYRAAADQALSVIAQIEDPDGIADAAAIAAVPEIDAVLIGRGDLSVAQGLDNPDHPTVVEQAEAALRATLNAGKVAMVFTLNPAEVSRWKEFGATLFALGLDTALLRAAARKIGQDFKAGG